MARSPMPSLPRAATWTCRQCQHQTSATPLQSSFRASLPFRTLSTSRSTPREMLLPETDIPATGFEVTAAPPINFSKKAIGEPARLIPASASYFTTSPLFNDHILKLTKLLQAHESLPVLPADQTPRMTFMTLAQFRSSLAEKVGAAKYARALDLMKRLNRIDPALRPPQVQQTLEQFQRPGSANVVPSKPKTLDKYGRAMGVGRRKSSVARVQLIEGTGEVMINGKSISQALPRLHDRESAVWPLKVTNRLDKYNVFVMVSGGGKTGQAESITLGMANALMIHEPALKPTLRKAGCVTRIMKRVERKKTGRVKARKRPAWVKR